MWINGAFMCGPGKCRGENQDNYYFNGRYRKDPADAQVKQGACRLFGKGIFAVADGMGGEAHGELASLYVVRKMEQELASCKNKSRILKYLQDRNAEICALTEKTGGKLIGSTFVGVRIGRKTVEMVNIGDSRAYLLRGGKLYQISRDHTLVRQMVDMGVLTPEAARQHSSRHKLTQHLGIPEEEMLIEPYSLTVPVQSDDLLLLCSDGLTDMLSDPQIRQMLAAKGTVKEKTARLYHAAMEAGGKDNISVMILQLRCGSRKLRGYEQIEEVLKAAEQFGTDPCAADPDKTKRIWYAAAAAVLAVLAVGGFLLLRHKPDSSEEKEQTASVQSGTAVTEKEARTEPEEEQPEVVEPQPGTIEMSMSTESEEPASEGSPIAAGDLHWAVLQPDGTVKAGGDNKFGQRDVGDWTDIIAVAAGASHTVGLRKNGTVVAVGDKSYRQCAVEDWTNIIAIAAGDGHTVGLKADGTVVAVGDNSYGQCDVGDWTNIIAIAAGGGHTVGLKADGTVVAVGLNNYGQCDVEDWKDIIAINATDWYTVGMKQDGFFVVTEEPDSRDHSTIEDFIDDENSPETAPEEDEIRRGEEPHHVEETAPHGEELTRPGEDIRPKPENTDEESSEAPARE